VTIISDFQAKQHTTFALSHDQREEEKKHVHPSQMFIVTSWCSLSNSFATALFCNFINSDGLMVLH